MTAELEVSVVNAERASRLGYVAHVAVDAGAGAALAVGGTSSDRPTVLASADARRFSRRRTPRRLGLRAALAHGGAWWTCGEYGQLARSSDRGATWAIVPTATNACLYALAQVGDDVWVAGDRGYCARVRDGMSTPVDIGTSDALVAIAAHAGAVVLLGRHGAIYRWSAGAGPSGGAVAQVATGATAALAALAITRRGTWIAVGDGGFITRSPDGAWFSRAASGTGVDLEAIAVLADGRVAVVGDRGYVALSADEGRSWRAVPAGTSAHLWSIARCGDGALIGGDAGWIARLAAPAAPGAPGELPQINEEEGDDYGGDDDDGGSDDDDGDASTDDDDDDDGGSRDDEGDGDDDDTDGEVFQS